MRGYEKILIIIGIIFISFNLRAPITAVGSVVGMIQADSMFSSGMVGFITTLPLLTFAIVSPFVAKSSQKLGYGKLMAFGLFFILIGELVRSYTNLIGIFIGTTFLGIGIAIGNVLIPGIIKLKFSDKVGLMTSIYTSGMCTFAAIGAGLSIPLAKDLDLGWKNALAFWVVLTAITLLIWLPQFKAKRNSNVNHIATGGASATSIWKSPTAWWVTLFMGTQSFLFYSLVAWLPTIIISTGMKDSFAGTMALAFQLVAIPATLIIPLLCDKFKNQRGLVSITCLLYISGMSLFLISQTQMSILLSVALMALGMGGSISLSIAFISLRSPNSVRASELSGMSQSAGYLLAAVGPILMGVIYDTSKSWLLPVIIFCGLIILLGFFGWFAGNDIKTEIRPA
ncbi:CynX/NimT family MFS transporter [Methanogenium cariaci]